MTVRNLEFLFKPRSIAVIGAGANPESVGHLILRNIRAAGFPGPIYVVNPHGGEIEGVICSRTVAELPAAPDLAVIAIPPESVAETVAELGARGCRAGVIITAGFGEGGRPEGAARRTAVLNAARPYNFRIIGPNCLGIAVPQSRLNASFTRTTPTPGSIALIAQSGAVAATMVDWADARGIGFSHVITLGDMIDVDFADTLDYLAADPATRAILLYIEGVTHPRKFMSAARAAARIKPVLAVKSGRYAATARVTASHTGALAGSDAIYDAALARAGILRVDDLDDLFDVASLLASGVSVNGDRLGIITNGGGLGALAADRLIGGGGRLADLSPETLARLDGVLPPTWSRGNPVDLIGDAGPSKYAAAVAALSEDSGTDAVLVMHCPTAVADPDAVAAAVAAPAPGRRPLLTAWLGDTSVAVARTQFAQRRTPTFATPSDAVNAFMDLARYRKLQNMLMEVPPAAAEIPAQAVAAAAGIVGRVTEASWLPTQQARDLLSFYQIPCVRAAHAITPVGAGAIARRWSCLVALKINSPDILHKSDVGGVALGLAPEGVEQAARDMLLRIKAKAPLAAIAGFTVEEMIVRPNAHELLLGMVRDETFGPAIAFGHGGTAVEVINDRTFGLPPLNVSLAGGMISATRIGRLLTGYRDRPPADIPAIAQALVHLSQLVSDHPGIVELDINPLLADEHGVIALDVRIKVDPSMTSGLVIEPYPSGLVQTMTLGGEELLVRPVRPEDAALVADLLRHLSPEDQRLRFASTHTDIGPDDGARLTQIDYDRDLALIAIRKDHSVAGLMAFHADPDRTRAEFAIAVRSDLSGRGIGGGLVRRLADIARARKIGCLWGQIAAENIRMVSLCRRLGMETRNTPPDGTIAELRLTS
jgi:acetyltransferase